MDILSSKTEHLVLTLTMPREEAEAVYESLTSAYYRSGAMDQNLNNVVAAFGTALDLNFPTGANVEGVQPECQHGMDLALCDSPGGTVHDPHYPLDRPEPDEPWF